MTTIILPEDVARRVFAHLNGDEGWRSKVADQLVRADAFAPNPAERRRADDLRALVIALGVLSAKLAAELPTNPKGR